MSIFFDGKYEKPIAISQKRKAWPFDFDRVSFTFDQDFIQFWEKFSPLALDTTDIEFSNCYLVAESNPKDEDGGICKFTRTFAMIPETRDEQEAFAYQIPGRAGTSFGTPQGVTETHTATTSTFTATAHGYLAGAVVTLGYYVTINGATYLRQQDRIILSKTTDTFTTAIVTDTLTPSFDTVKSGWLARVSKTQTVTSKVTFDYFLPGVSLGISSFADIPILTPSGIVSASGVETNTYSATTVPTITEHFANVYNGTWIVVEPSIVTRWKGNIFQRQTRYVRAQ